MEKIPDWKTQPEEYKKYLEERIPMILIEFAQRKFAQKRINKDYDQERAS